MTAPTPPASPAVIDWLNVAREHEQFSLNGQWIGVQTPHYSLSGLFRALGDEIATLRAALAAPPTPRGEVQGGYADAFYEIAELLGLQASTDSPAVVWKRDMLPRLAAALSTPRAEIGDDARARAGKCLGGFVLELSRMHGGGFKVVGLDGKELPKVYGDQDEAHEALEELQIDAILAAFAAATPAPAVGDGDAPYRHLIDWIVEGQEMGRRVYIWLDQDGAWGVGSEEKLKRSLAATPASVTPDGAALGDEM